MSKLLSITKYEYKMQMKRIAGWIVLLFVLVSSMMDCLPTASNIARIEFLGDIHYYVRRVFSFDGLVLLFGILFLTAGRNGYILLYGIRPSEDRLTMDPIFIREH